MDLGRGKPTLNTPSAPDAPDLGIENRPLLGALSTLARQGLDRFRVSPPAPVVPPPEFLYPDLDPDAPDFDARLDALLGPGLNLDALDEHADDPFGDRTPSTLDARRQGLHAASRPCDADDDIGFLPVRPALGWR